jgi:DNA polymerase kappa
MAREKGVKSGMPGFIGKKLCSELVFIKTNYSKYREAANVVKSILYKYDPFIESTGLDEAAIDVTDYLRKNNMD